MDPEKPEAPLDLGIYGRQVRAKVELVDIVAAALSLIWVATVAGFWFFIGISSGVVNSSGFSTSGAVIIGSRREWKVATPAGSLALARLGRVL